MDQKSPYTQWTPSEKFKNNDVHDIITTDCFYIRGSRTQALRKPGELMRLQRCSKKKF